MSENLSLPGVRVPLVAADGTINREWLRWFTGMFARVGGSEGYSNAELYGDAAALQSYDELLERVAALESDKRGLQQAVQMLAMGQMEQMSAMPPTAISPDTFSRIKVLGETDLATDRGNVRIGKGINGSTAKLQLEGDAEFSGVARVRGAMQVDGEMSSGNYRVLGVKVVGERVAGVHAFTAYPGQTMDADYDRTQAQATDDAIKAASTQLALLNSALRTHGLIGD